MRIIAKCEIENKNPITMILVKEEAKARIVAEFAQQLDRLLFKMPEKYNAEKHTIEVSYYVEIKTEDDKRNHGCCVEK